MSDLSDLEFFALTVRHGGFSAASRATGIEKSRLSRRVTALEKRLGVSLLHRTTRTVVLSGGELLTAPRVLLHAAELGFVHPQSGRRVFFESPLPQDFEAALAELRQVAPGARR